MSTICYVNLTAILTGYDSELQQLFQRIHDLVAKRFPEQQKDLPWQAVNAFCFLRYLVPAILHPQLNGLYPGMYID